MSEAVKETLKEALHCEGVQWTLDELSKLAYIRIVNMELAWQKLRDSPQATPDIKAVAEGFVGPKPCGT